MLSLVVLDFAVSSCLHIESSYHAPATECQTSVLIYWSKASAAASYQHAFPYLRNTSTMQVLLCTCNSMPELFVDIQEQAEEILKLVRAANPHVLPHLPSAQAASNLAATSASASVSASASASASAAPTASHPPSKAAAALSTPTASGKQTQSAASATVSPPMLPPIDAASESKSPLESCSNDEPGFPEVGLIHVSPQMVQTLMLQCLLPCHNPDHDFGQLMYAPWLHYLVLSAGQLQDKSTVGTQQALMLHMLPCVELAGESCFVDCPFCVPCNLMITPAPCLEGLSCRATRALQT